MANLDIFCGKWLLIESDDQSVFLDAVGVSPEIKKKSQEMVHGMTKEVRHEGDRWHMRTTLSDRVIEYDYTVGQVADKVGLDGRPMKGKLFFENNGKADIMVEDADGDGYHIRHERWVEGDYLLQKIIGNGVTIHRKYKKVD